MSYEREDEVEGEEAEGEDEEVNELLLPYTLLFVIILVGLPFVCIITYLPHARLFFISPF